MRAAMRIAEPHRAARRWRGWGASCAQSARDLGAVRDLDVLIEHARHFRDELPADQQADMDGLLAAWDDDREKARRTLLRLLKSRDYARFTSRMTAFLDEEDAAPDEADGAVPYQVRHVNRERRLGAGYEEVRAYENPHGPRDGSRSSTPYASSANTCATRWSFSARCCPPTLGR